MVPRSCSNRYCFAHTSSVKTKVSDALSRFTRTSISQSLGRTSVAQREPMQRLLCSLSMRLELLSVTEQLVTTQLMRELPLNIWKFSNWPSNQKLCYISSHSNYSLQAALISRIVVIVYWSSTSGISMIRSETEQNYQSSPKESLLLRMLF